MKREEICEVVHEELDRLKLRSGKPKKHDVSQNGIYFWYEKSEIRQTGGQRVTRVGTHEKPSRLHERIKEHYGLNREGSAFRKHLGGALMGRNREPKSEIEEWYKARRGPRFNDQKFRNYEAQVTSQAKLGNYRVLRVDNSNERLQLEEKLIALFSHCKHCRPSENWLGNYAYRKEIRDSGLWNIDYVCSLNEFSESDLPRLKQLVDESLRGE
jgi:hypothetical protein